jgi:asparagine synthase (glutamine-hydrolysing)
MSMAAEIRHRGPDSAGLYLDGAFGMACTRLAIVDVEGGDQPLSDEHGRFWAMQNGEIYNYVELRAELASLGHVFATGSDTEVVAHAYRQWGRGCLARFNGDFAVAVWDRDRRELFLARDRFGVRPLYLADTGGDLCFASEVKALLRHPGASRALDPRGIVETFTLWSTLPERSAFAGVRELPPAHYLIVGPAGPGRVTRWWGLEFEPEERPEADTLEELDALLVDATRLRLRADVPVAAYISGGLDSAAVAAIAARETGSELDAFGIGFTDGRFDESSFQDDVVRDLGVRFHRTLVDAAAIGDALPRVVELAETPLLRTAPAPLLLLSEAVHDAGLRVVLTGEGADELFAGYDIFKEDKVRRFWARDPSSRLRPLLFARLNRFLAADVARGRSFLAGFYARDLLALDDPLYSHRLRFVNTARCLRLLDPELLRAAEDGGPAPAESLIDSLPPGFGGLSALSRAQVLEITTFLQGYLLHGQGDRMLMGNSVEGRFPYLDHRVAELAARLPDSMRLRGLQEKYALRRAVAHRVPPSVGARAKQPYRAPIGHVLAGPGAPEYVRELLDASSVRNTGLLDAAAVGRLQRKLDAAGGAAIGETDEMGFVGSLTLMLLHDRLVAHPPPARTLEPDRVVVGARVRQDRSVNVTNVP